jgi:hypothetical protein
MNVLRRFIVTIAGLCLSIVISILVMINGWGLEPKSYWWIIGVSLIGHLTAQITVKLGISGDD